MGYCKDCKNGEDYKGGIYCNYYKQSYSEYEGCSNHFSPKNGSTSGCYLTTACVDIIGKPDNCYELQTLRKFRDNYLASLPEGIQEINEYYRISPLIVDAISRSNNSREEYTKIYSDLILETIALIDQYRFESAHLLYKNYVHNLALKYLIDND